MDKILVVDDDEILIGNMIKKNIKRSDYDILTVSGDNQFVNIVEKKPCLVITDLEISKTDNLDLMKKLKNSDDVELILVAGHRNINTAVEFLMIEEAEFLIKPVDLNGLEIIINQAIKKQKQQIVFVDKSLKCDTSLKKSEINLKKTKKSEQFASAAKNNFFKNISHELRTPLNAIVGMCEFLYNTSLDNDQKESVNIIKESSDSLLFLIDDMLDYIYLKSSITQLNYIDFDFRNLICDFAELFAYKAKSKGIKFESLIHYDIPSLLKGDPGKVRHILSILLRNAIEFTGKGKVSINITIENEYKKNILIKFSIKNTGIDITKEDINQLSAFFSQADTFTKLKLKDNWIGLALAKHITKLIKGNIGIESVEAQGYCFWFTAMFEKQIIKDRHILNNDEVVVKNKRILIVDDHILTCKVLGKHFESWGIQYDIAYDGKSALKKLYKFAEGNDRFDIAIIDKNMPEINGCELGKIILDTPSIKDTQLIMLTAFGESGDAEHIKKIGFQAYLNKPVSGSLALDCIKQVLKRKNNTDISDNSLITRYSINEDKKKNITILIAEDYFLNQKIVQHILKKNGFYSECVVNGMEAVKALEKKKYDIVLMDIQMPIMNGIQATKTIRNIDSKVINHNIPIVALTAQTSPEYEKLCFYAGMDDFLTKPVRPKKLIGTIEQILNLKPVEMVYDNKPVDI